MGRSLPFLTLALLALLWPTAAQADPFAISDASSFQSCFTQAGSRAMECVVEDIATERTSGTAEISGGIFAATLPTTRALDVVVRFENPGCLVWNHRAAFPYTGEPGNTSNPVEIVRLEAPSGTVAGSSIRFVDPCVEEWRDGVRGGDASTVTQGVVVTGAGIANVTVDLVGSRINRTSSAGSSADVVGVNSNSSVSGGVTYVQGAMPDGSDHAGLLATTTDPASIQYGYGVSFGTGTEFAATPANEPDNMLGSFYNKAGVNSTGTLNQWEHGFDDSWELSYRGTSVTSDQTLLERNWDLWPAVNSVVVDSHDAGFDPTAGTILTFSAGTNAQGYAVSWTAGTDTLVWRHDFGALEGTTVTVTEAASDGSDTATITVASVDNVSNLNKVRAYQFEWNTLTDSIYHSFRTTAGETVDSFRVQNGGTGAGVSGSIGGGVGMFVGSQSDNTPALKVLHQTTGLLTDTANVETLGIDLQLDFGGTNNTYNSSSGIRILSPITTGSGSTNSAGRRRAIEVFNQRGYGAAGSVFYAHTQSLSSGSCLAEPGTCGNITHEGGGWNNGHISFNGETNNDDHLWVDSDVATHVLRYSVDDSPDDHDDGAQILTGRNEASNPCATAPPGYVFYTDASAGAGDLGYYCFCNSDATSEAKQLHDPTAACGF